MGFTVKENTKVAIENESTEGTYVAPTGAASFIAPLSDGVALDPAKELLDRNNLNASIGKSLPRTGMRSVSASLPVEYKANGTAGSEPEYGLLLEAGLGSKRQMTTAIISGSSHTSTVINHADGYIGDVAVGDMVLVKEAGAYEVRPVTAVDSTPGSANFTLAFALENGAPSNAVHIEKFTTYYPANSGHKSISVTKYVEDAIRETAVGCKVTNISLSNFSTGQLPELSISLEGLTYGRSLTAPAYTPSYDSALPPIVLEACIWQDGSKITVNNIDWSIDNSLGFVMSTCNANGKVSSRITERTVTGNIDPYKEDNDISQFTKFDNNTTFALFGYAFNPTGTAGEFGDVVSFYMPSCIITSLGEGDQDGILQNTIAFQATRGADGSSQEIYLGFI